MCQIISIKDHLHDRTTLTKQGVSDDTVECLEFLLEAAKRGEVIGLAYAAMHQRRQYTIHACGEAYRNPTMSSGMVGALFVELQMQAREGPLPPG